MIIKFTKGKLLDICAIALFLSFMLGITITNFGEFPYNQEPELYNLIASLIYIMFILLFVWLSSVLQRKRLIIFNAVILSVSLLFSAWYFFATVNEKAVPDFLVSLFSVLTYFLHTQLIGLYYFIKPIDPVLYGTLAFLLYAIADIFAVLLLLNHFSYFDKLKSIKKPRMKKERISKEERMRREIIEERKNKSK